MERIRYEINNIKEKQMDMKSELEQDEPFYKLYKFTLELPLKQAVVLSYLIDTENFSKYTLSNDTDYFECCWTNYAEKALGKSISKKIWISAINELLKDGYIFKKVKNNNCTFYKLNKSRIRDLKKTYDNDDDETADDVIIRR